jgi:hypothetical protein
MAENKKDKEYYDKVFDIYKDKSNDFKTSFSILMGFAVIFFFIILLPHFSLLLERQEIAKDVSRVEDDMDMIEK